MAKKIIFWAVIVVFGLVSLFAFEKLTLSDGRLHLVFCDVGQGDAIFIRTPGGQDLLIDGGPDEKVLDCLGRHMPFWDRRLEMVVLTHPHADHLTGLIAVMKRFSLTQFVQGSSESETEGYKRLKEEISQKPIKTNRIKRGDRFRVRGDGNEVLLTVLWPEADLVVSDLNDRSIVFLLTFGAFEALLTGDAGREVHHQTEDIPVIELLKVPHHGSRTGLSEEFLKRIKPQLAVISVGKNNRYGHPHEEVIRVLEDQKIRMLRTDRDGEVEVVSDGRSWSVNLGGSVFQGGRR